MRRLSAIIIAMLPALAALPADMPEIFHVVADQCQSNPERRFQTGFLAQGYDGVFTALHGVVGCAHISARGYSTGRSFAGLEIGDVDIARDVVLLRGLPDGPFARLALAPPAKPNDKAWLVGYPQAITTQFRTDVIIENPNLLLEARIPDLQEIKTPLLLRSSPSINVRILSLSGDIQPGHSGAPLLNANNRVVGIGNGGLREGTVGIGWAIPFADLDLTPSTDSAVALSLAGLITKDPALVFAVSTGEDVQAPEPVAWSEGEACLPLGSSFDLDAGAFESRQDNADLFYENVDGIERYLRPWRSSFATGGVAELSSVNFAQVRDAAYRSDRLDARWGGGIVRPGTLWFVKTSENRFSKMRILRDGSYLKFQWYTYSKAGEGSLPLPTSSGSCSVEEERLCGAGALPGDAIHGFHVEDLKRTEAVLRVTASYNSAHGQVYVVPMLLDRNGENISGGYRPTLATGSSTIVPVLYLRPGRAASAELLVYLFESGRPAEAFICRRFPFRQGWGQ